VAQPKNVEEFHAVAALILDQLLRAFPLSSDLDILAIAKEMGLANRTDKLESGRSLEQIASATNSWLIDNGYIAPHNLELPGNRRVLTAKGLTGLNYVPKPDGVTISEKIEAQKPVASTAEGKSKLSELIGEMIGAGLASFTKTISS